MYNLNEREMRMQVRLFYNDFCKDIPLDGKSKFSIGSGKNDGFCLSDSDLKKNHVVLTTQKYALQRATFQYNYVAVVVTFQKYR